MKKNEEEKNYYLDTVAMNLENSKKRFENELKFIEYFSARLEDIRDYLLQSKDKHGNHQFLWIHFFSLIEKNVLASLTNILEGQTDVALFPMRSAIEILLILGKIADGKDNYDVWANKFSRLNKKYSELFSGKKLVSESIQNSPDLQEILKTINDYFAHPNPFFYGSSFVLEDLPDGEVSYTCPFLSNSTTEQGLVLFSLMRVVSFVYDGILSLFKDRFADFPEERFGKIVINSDFSDDLVKGFSSREQIVYKKIARVI